MKALVTGFEPFGSDPVNPSLEAMPAAAVAARRARDRDPGAADRVRPRASTRWRTRWRRRVPTSCCASGWPAAAPRCRSNGSRSTSTTRASPTTTGGSRSTAPVVAGGPAGVFRDPADQGRGRGAARGRAAGDRLEHRRHLCLQPCLLRPDAPRRDAAAGIARRLSAPALSAGAGGAIARIGRAVDGARRYRARRSRSCCGRRDAHARTSQRPKAPSADGRDQLMRAARRACYHRPVCADRASQRGG